jgi:hypothetical protein
MVQRHIDPGIRPWIMAAVVCAGCVGTADNRHGQAVAYQRPFFDGRQDAPGRLLKTGLVRQGLAM